MTQWQPSRRAALTGLAALSASAFTGAGLASAAVAPEPAKIIDLGTIGVSRTGGGNPVRNTELIQAALNNLTDNCVLHIPAGTYLIAPTPPTGTSPYSRMNEPILALPPCRNLTVRGDGEASVLKVADMPDAENPYHYGSVLGFAKGPVEPDLVLFHDFAVDHNCEKNKVRVLWGPEGKSPVVVATVSTHAHTPRFGRITVRGLSIRNADSRVSLYFPGEADSGSVAVHDCRWTEASHRTGASADDHSFINATCASLTVQHNRFHGVSWAKAPRTAIETHASSTLVQGNLIERFQLGINMTGNARHGGTTHRHLCQDNLIEASRDGILIWSHRYGTHATELGFEDMVVSGNMVTLRPEHYTSPPFTGKGLRGIGVFAVKDPEEGAPSIGFRNLLIAGNTIRYPLESAVPDYVYLTEQERRAGALHFALHGTTGADALYDNVRITGNTVHDCAFSGLYLDGGRWRGLQVDGNSFLDCGYSTSGRRNPPYSNKVLRIAGRLLTDCVISGNTFHTTSRPYGKRSGVTSYLRLEHTGQEKARFLLSGNVIAIDPAVTTLALTEYAHLSGERTQWTMDGAVPRAGVPITNQAHDGTGSRVRVDETGVIATRVADSWRQQGFGPAAPTGPGHTAGDVWVNTAISVENPVERWVCLRGGPNPVWREVRI